MRASPFALVAAAAAVALLAGCAAEPTAVAAAPAAAADNPASKPAAKPEAITGSRIARPGTDRIVRAIDNQTFRDDTSIRSIGNEVGMRGN